MRAPPTSSRSAPPRLRGALSLLALFVSTAAGCASSSSSSHVYLPAEHLTSVVEGRPAASYPIPPEAPAGEVRLHSFGVVGQQGEGDEAPALHVLLWISNAAGARPWTLDTRRVRLELRDGGDSRPTPVTSEAASLPTVEIPPGEQRIVEMLFPLPEGYTDADALPAFDVIWQVQTDSSPAAGRTPFERIQVDAGPSGPTWGYAYGYGHGWWYDPWWRPGSGYPSGRGVALQNRDAILQPRVHVRPMRPARPAPR